MLRWFAVHDTCVVEGDDPVNYCSVDGHLEPAETCAEPWPNATERSPSFS